MPVSLLNTNTISVSKTSQLPRKVTFYGIILSTHGLPKSKASYSMFPHLIYMTYHAIHVHTYIPYYTTFTSSKKLDYVITFKYGSV